jgi:hypothetical protein
MKLRNSVATAIVMATALTASPVWADTTQLQQQQVTLQTQQQQITPAAKESIDKVTAKFPKLQGYSQVLIRNAGQHVAHVELLKKDAAGKLYTVGYGEVDLLSGQIQEWVVAGGKLDKPLVPVSAEEVKSKAAEYLAAIVGEEAKEYKLVSYWQEETFFLGKKQLLSPTVNFRAPIKGDTSKASYIQINLNVDGTFQSFVKENKSVAYDSWFAAELNKRVKPNDELSEPMKRSYQKLTSIFPMLTQYTNQVVSLDKDGTGKLHVKKGTGENAPYVTIKFDQNGNILSFSRGDVNTKPATDTIAKVKALDFLARYFGEGAKQYKIITTDTQTLEQNYPNGQRVETSTRLVVFQKLDKSGNFVVGITSTGEVYTFYQTSIYGY